MNYPLLIRRNLLRNPRRTILTSLGITLSFFLFVAIFTLLESFQFFLKNENAQVNLFFRPVFMGSFIDGQIPEAYLQQLRSIPLLRHLSPYKVYLGQGRSEADNVFVLGVTPQDFASMRSVEGVTPSQLDAFARSRQGALVGEEVMKKNRWKLGDEIQIRGIRGLPNLQLHILGSPLSRSDVADIVLARYDYLRDVMPDGGSFSVALLRVMSPYQVPWIAEIVRERFENSAVPVEVITEKSFIESFLSELASITFSMKLIAWVTLLATLFVAGNTMAMSIRERKVEQGTLRTLGFSRRRVFSLYMTESFLLCLGSALAGGIGACWIFTQWELSLPSGGPGMQGLLIRPYWAILQEVFLLALGMGLLSGFPPSYFALRQKISETLRETG